MFNATLSGRFTRITESFRYRPESKPRASLRPSPRPLMNNSAPASAAQVDFGFLPSPRGQTSPYTLARAAVNRPALRHRSLAQRTTRCIMGRELGRENTGTRGKTIVYLDSELCGGDKSRRGRGASGPPQAAAPRSKGRARDAPYGRAI